MAGFPVTAYGMCNGLGSTTAEVVSALRSGRSGLAAPPLDLPFETFCGSVARDLEGPPPSLARYDTHLLRMTLRALDELAGPVEAAVRRWGRDRVAIILGTSTGGIEQTEEAYQGWRREGQLPETYRFDDHHPFHLVASALAELFGVTGPCSVISTACSAGGKTLAAASRLIAADLVDAAVTGAVDGLCQTTLRGFHSLSILSDEPCRPFSRERRGISIGEGAALLLVEREGEGPARLLGVGESSDAYHMSSPDPEGQGARAAMIQALEAARRSPEEVDHINSHGTGTVHNDASESQAIFDLFGSRVPVVSTKGYTGHLLGAGGATEAIFAIIALEQGWVPATLGADPLDETLRIQVVTERRELPCRLVLSNSFGFGGSNVSVLLGASA